jgi:pyruvate,water dikinase
MIDAKAAGVVYTRNPVQLDDDCLLVNSVFGLGQLLVDGTLTPDVFRVSRETGEVVEFLEARKEVRLLMSPASGTVTEPVPDAEQDLPSLDPDQLRDLARMAQRIEDHYGGPQDIEWVLDNKNQLFILQARPLKLVRTPAHEAEPDLSGLQRILSGGSTVCPGAGSGTVYRVSSSADLPGVPDDCVLVAPRPIPGLYAVLGKVAALVTESGGVASHLATLARESRVPTIMGAARARRIPAGETVTVDATHAAIYAGAHPQVVQARRREREAHQDNELLLLLDRVLAWVSPLNLLHPADPGFVAENCRTFHDITRFCHQRAMQEMLEGARGLGRRESIGVRLKSDIPLPVKIVYLDRDPTDHQRRRWVAESEIESEPMEAFWAGLKEEGWPQPRMDVQGRPLKVEGDRTRGRRGEFAEDSYAILSKEYMIVSLRMGYHFTTIEAICSEEPNKNFIHVQYKQGGAAMDRRLRRLQLVSRILRAMGFEISSKGDFLDSRINYLRCREIRRKLKLIGRLTIMTKQLDMALPNDPIADWYTKDFMRKLGVGEGSPPGQQAGDGAEVEGCDLMEDE